MLLVERHIVNKQNKQFKQIDHLCFLSKNLYNTALYTIKQEYLKSGKFLRYSDLDNKLRSENNIDYKLLPNNTSQQILRKLDKNIKSYFVLLKMWKKNKKSLNGCPKFPRYKHKISGRNLLIFTYAQFTVKKNGYIPFPKMTGLNILKTNIKELDSIVEMRIIPKNRSYVIEIVYEKPETEMIVNDNKAAIDLGVNNLATITFNNSYKTYIINGRPLKSINQYYNKLKSEYQSDLMKRNVKITNVITLEHTKINKVINDTNNNYLKTSKLNDEINLTIDVSKFYNSNRIINLTNKRNNKVLDYLHKSSCKVVNILKENNISELVIGYNPTWKQEINIGSKNNQNFVNIPFLTFINQIVYKCKLQGINVIVNEESYTSRASAMSLDVIPVYKKSNGKIDSDNETNVSNSVTTTPKVKCESDSNKSSSTNKTVYKFGGYRLKRGLYKVKGIKNPINSDVNGSLNIGRKAFGNEYVSNHIIEFNRGHGYCPVKISC
jgi:putative transposase